MKILREFREFALKGNVIDMAVGVIIGAGFGKIVNSLVTDVLTPPLGLISSKANFADQYIHLGTAQIAIGKFINAVIEFTIVAFVIFLIIQQTNRLRAYFDPVKPPEPPTKACPECLSKIPAAARKCAFCTSTQTT